MAQACTANRKNPLISVFNCRLVDFVGPLSLTGLSYISCIVLFILALSVSPGVVVVVCVVVISETVLNGIQSQFSPIEINRKLLSW